MENFEKETPFAENFEEFKNYYEEKWKEQWSEEVVEIMRDAYCVGISEMSVERDLYQNDFISIYKNIIIRCRFLELQARQQQDKAWKKQLKNTRKHYQVELLKFLTATIRDFCMEED